MRLTPTFFSLSPLHHSALAPSWQGYRIGTVTPNHFSFCLILFSTTPIPFDSLFPCSHRLESGACTSCVFVHIEVLVHTPKHEVSLIFFNIWSTLSSAFSFAHSPPLQQWLKSWMYWLVSSNSTNICEED